MFNTLIRRAATAAGAALCCLGLVGTASAAVTLPPVNGQFDYQIGGAYTPAASVAIVDRDRLADPVAGKYNICYVNAFQTQPSEVAWWQANHDNLLLRDGAGNYVVDEEWNEILLDTRTSAKRTAISGILAGWMSDCGTRGFQAIEPDNLDSWDRSGGLITKANNLALMTLMAQSAHASNLAIAQKNTSEIADEGKNQIGFDFVIAEECQRYSGEFGRECDDFRHYYGNQVYEIEYTDNGGLTNFNKACTARGAAISVIYRDRQVVPFGQPAYTYQYC